MKIASWDIGIKNLAYCIFETTDNNDKPYNIHHWNIINLIQDDEIKCSWKDCSNTDIKFTTNLIGDKFYLCKDHKSYFSVIQSKWEMYKNNLLELEKDNNEKCISCDKNAKWKIGDKHLCTTHKTNGMKKWEVDMCLKKYSSAKVKQIPVDKIKLSLFTKLDQIPYILDVDEVCIENQPSFKNPRMKAIADSLYSYYLIRGVIDKKNNPINKVNYISPSNKLKIENQEDDINEEIENANNKYKKTKQLSINYCQDILKYDESYISHLKQFKKKDDLADCFLQGVYYLSKIKK